MPSLELVPINEFIVRLEAFLKAVLASNPDGFKQIRISTKDEFGRVHQKSLSPPNPQQFPVAEWPDSIAPLKSHYNSRPTEWPMTITVGFSSERQWLEFIFTKDSFWVEVEFPAKQHLKPSVHFSDLLFEHCKRVDDGKVLRDAMPKELTSVFDAQYSSLSAMQAHTGELKSTLIDLAKSQAEHIQKITTTVTNDSLKMKRVNDDANKTEQERLSALDIAIKQKEDDLNLRENRGVRRELLDLIKNQIKEQNDFSFTQSTWRKSLVVHAACVAAMLLGIGLASTFIVPMVSGNFRQTVAKDEATTTKDEATLKDAATTEPYGTTTSAAPLSWYQFAPFPAGLILFGSTFVFYVRWMSRWFKNHADSEISNLQYGKDILRASWIAELIFEAASESRGGKVEIPEYLLQQFCSGLFEHSVDGGQTHPIEDLQKYATRFKKFTVGAKGIEVEANGKK